MAAANEISVDASIARAIATVLSEQHCFALHQTAFGQFR